MIRLAPTLAAALVCASLLPGLAGAQGDESASVTFQEQGSGGHAVLVQQASLPEGGFVAIHDATLVSGQDPLGSVVGVSAFLDAGAHEDVRVHLTRALSGDNETLIAMPHKDTNGNRLYDFVASQGADDGPYAGGPDSQDTFAGPLVIEAAKAVVGASIHVQDQERANALLVDVVDLKDGGFVAIHDATLVTEQDPFGSVVGVSRFLDPGIHHDVRVALDAEPADATLIAMPHKDTNGNRQYDFVTSQGAHDGPYAGTSGTFAGDIVIAQFAGTPSRDARVAFPPQATGGNVVLVESVFLPSGGFVAIHDSTLVTEQDPFGSVVGVSDKLAAGAWRNVVVELDRALDAPADTLVAMPHKDTNGNDRYDFITSQGAEDGPFVGGPAAQETFAGDIVIAVADVNRTAGAFLAPQVVDGEVVVAYADLAEPGFVAIHDASLLAGAVFESVVGVSERLDAGLHENVRVRLDAPLRASTTLIAMPHKDTNGNRQYDFVTSQGADDGPFTGGAGPGGLVVAVAFGVAPKGGADLPDVRAGPVPDGSRSTPGVGGADGGDGGGATPTPATPTGATPTPATGGAPTGGSTPTPRGEEAAGNDAPGFTLAVAAAALALALLARVRRRPD